MSNRHRKPRGARVRVPHPLPVLFTLALALGTDVTGVVRLGFLSSLLHEAGHLAAWLLLVPAPPRVTVGVTGFCLSMRGAALDARGELALAAAGPAVNLALGCGLWLAMQCGAHAAYARCYFACANLLLGSFNLLPLPGLDGARILCALRALAARKRRLHFPKK